MTTDRTRELRAKYAAEDRLTNPLGAESNHGVDAASECVGAVLELLDALEVAQAERDTLADAMGCIECSNWVRCNRHPEALAIMERNRRP